MTTVQDCMQEVVDSRPGILRPLRRARRLSALAMGVRGAARQHARRVAGRAPRSRLDRVERAAQWHQDLLDYYGTLGRFDQPPRSARLWSPARLRGLAEATRAGEHLGQGVRLYAWLLTCAATMGWRPGFLAGGAHDRRCVYSVSAPEGVRSRGGKYNMSSSEGQARAEERELATKAAAAFIRARFGDEEAWCASS